MAESFKYKRIKFLSGQQRIFLSRCKKKLRLADSELAKMLRISVRTFTDWKREKYCMAYGSTPTLAKKTSIPMPQHKILDQFWYVQKGARMGGLASYRKQGVIGGDPHIRKARWLSWWVKRGKFKKNPIFDRKQIRKPQKSSVLAEFVGIVMGDGGITERQLTIAFNSTDDRLYSYYVSVLMKKLFGVEPSIYKQKDAKAIGIVISKTNLVEYCHKTLGLAVGNKVKQQIDIPLWILKNIRWRV